MPGDTEAAHPSRWQVDRLVPFVHVGEVDASLAFYAMLGFGERHAMRDAAGRAFWALAQSGRGEIMFARADAPVDPSQQAVLFYMYSMDLAELRRRLLAGGVHDGGEYRGQSGPNGGRRVVFEVARRDYMPGGEMRVADPDGYCILVGQLA